VPRPESWPLRRTAVPSSASVPKASASPKAQSMRPPLAIDVAALVDEAAQLGMQVESSPGTGDAADHALQHLLVDRRARAEAADLLAGDRAQFLQFVVLARCSCAAS
jgi:hypothetical protein